MRVTWAGLVKITRLLASPSSAQSCQGRKFRERCQHVRGHLAPVPLLSQERPSGRAGDFRGPPMKEGTCIMQKKEREREDPRSQPPRLQAPGSCCGQHQGLLLPRQQKAGGGSRNFSGGPGTHREDRFQQQRQSVLNNARYSATDLVRKSE